MYIHKLIYLQCIIIYIYLDSRKQVVEIPKTELASPDEILKRSPFDIRKEVVQRDAKTDIL